MLHELLCGKALGKYWGGARRTRAALYSLRADPNPVPPWEWRQVSRW